MYSFLDYPIYEFRPNLPSITNHCIVNPWSLSNNNNNDDGNKHNQQGLTVYDCRDSNPLNPSSTKTTTKPLTIAIASFHHYPNKHELTRYEKLILSNHIGYCIKHKYIYFDVNQYVFNDVEIAKYFDSTIPSANAIFKAQKPFIIYNILTDNLYSNVIDYVLWVDFDAIF